MEKVAGAKVALRPPIWGLYRGLGVGVLGFRVLGFRVSGFRV